jgi:hypothetical protein
MSEIVTQSVVPVSPASVRSQEPKNATATSPWLTVKEATDRARCGPKLIYREVAASRLKAARVGGRRELRLLAEWIDDWLQASTTVQPAGARS